MLLIFFNHIESVSFSFKPKTRGVRMKYYYSILFNTL
jgi:hypothetical protein